MKKLRPVLENLDISQIVSVDDDYDINIGETLKSQEISYYVDSIDLSFEERTFLDDSGCHIIEELIETQDDSGKAILDKIVNYLEEKKRNDKESPLIWLEDAVAEIDCEKLKYIKLSKFSQIQGVSKKNTLWILDKDMNGVDSIYRSISEINNHFHDFINIFAIYTHDNSLEDLNIRWEKRFDYLRKIGFKVEEAQQLAYEFFVICKPKNLNVPEKSVFKKVIFNSIIGHIMNSVYNDIKNSKEKVLDQFEEFTKEVTFEKLSTFRYNVENEGEHNVYKLMNHIMNLMELQNYHDFMVKKVNYINVFKKVISNTKEKNEKQERLDTINLINKQYAWNKYQYINTDINYGYEDIQFGDAFEIELSNFYKNKFNLDDNKVIGVIITQSCDCIVRKDSGKRKKTMIELLLFNELNEITDSTCDNLFKYGIFLFKNDGNKPQSYILNNCSVGMICVDDAILDLTSLNKNGEAFILEDSKLKEEMELKKPIVWNKRPDMYNSLRKSRIIDRDIETQNSKIKTHILEARYGVKYSDKEQRFCVKRIGRLVYNNAHAILNNYINNIGRVGKESPNAICFQDHT